MQLQEVKLDVLPRGDVAEAARVARGDVAERVELGARQDALRNLDPKHLRIGVLPLPVGAAHEAEAAPLVRRDLATLELREHADELVDIGLVRERQPRAAEGVSILAGVHNLSLRTSAGVTARSAGLQPPRRSAARIPTTFPITTVPGQRLVIQGDALLKIGERHRPDL